MHCYSIPRSGGKFVAVFCPFNLPFRILLNTQLEQEKMAVAFELEDMLMRPDPQPLLEELIYEVSFCEGR